MTSTTGLGLFLLPLLRFASLVIAWIPFGRWCIRLLNLVTTGWKNAILRGMSVIVIIVRGWTLVRAELRGLIVPRVCIVDHLTSLPICREGACPLPLYIILK